MLKIVALLLVNVAWLKLINFPPFADACSSIRVDSLERPVQSVSQEHCNALSQLMDGCSLVMYDHIDLVSVRCMRMLFVMIFQFNLINTKSKVGQNKCGRCGSLSHLWLRLSFASR